jgi:amidase/aspartyl-tRNA(Asn)/glutamyl-tRNA(Gln) amidotransferase subunit A
LREIEAGLERSVSFSVELMREIDILVTLVIPVVNFPADQRGIHPSMPLRHTTFTFLFNQA